MDVFAAPPAHHPHLLGRKTMDPKEQFYRHFQAAVTSIQDQIGQLPSFSSVGGERQDAVENCLTGLSRLSNEVADASDFVPAYDQRTYSQAIRALTDQLNETLAQLAPKNRFQFKPRAAATSIPAQDDRRQVFGGPNATITSEPAIAREQSDSLSDLPSFPSKNYNEEMARPGGKGIRKPSFSAAREIAISGQTGLHIILPSTASRATSAGSLTDLRGCIVDMSVPTAGSAPFASLALRDINRCLIVAGHVAGPAHITGVRDSILVVAARQVRIHECANVDVYLHCTSHPIIEDCTGMRFAPIPDCYMADSVEPEKNQWDQVDDFKWLKTEHSPNWKVLPEAERVPEEVWRTTVPGGPGLSTEDILRKLGVGGR